MKLTVKTLKGTHFEIAVQPTDTIMAVKKNIEAVQGKDSYPWGQQLLIYSGKVLKDETTLEENHISENDFLVVMLTKIKASAVGTSSTTAASQPAQHPVPQPAPPPVATDAPQQTPSVPANSATSLGRTEAPSDTYGQAASKLVPGSNLESVVQQLMEMGGGSWDKDTVKRALRAAYNNPEHAVEYLYSGVPESTEVAVPEAHPPLNQATNTGADAATLESPLSGLPNSAPLNMFPEEMPNDGAGADGGSLDFLRNSHQFQALRAMVQANPQILQPMLQELARQNPHVLRLIQEHHAEFLQLLNEPVEDVEGDLFDQADQEMPHAINVTPAEQEAIARLEAMGFDRARVIEAFLACDRNEELAANYLLENAGEED